MLTVKTGKWNDLLKNHILHDHVCKKVLLIVLYYCIPIVKYILPSITECWLCLASHRP